MSRCAVIATRASSRSFKKYLDIPDKQCRLELQKRALLETEHFLGNILTSFISNAFSRSCYLKSLRCKVWP
jgi:hypothetical protein